MDYKEIIPEYFDSIEERYNDYFRINEFFNKNSSGDVIFISDIIVEQVKSNFEVMYTEGHIDFSDSVFNIPNIKREYKPIIEIIDKDNRLRNNFIINNKVYYNRVNISLSSKIEKLIGIPIKSLLDRIDSLKKDIVAYEKTIKFERNRFSEIEKVLREEKCGKNKNLKFIERLKYLFLGSKYFS